MVERSRVLVQIEELFTQRRKGERFRSRTRHSGHLDRLKANADLLPTFQQHPALGPLGIGQLVTVNTEGNVSLEDLLSSVCD